MSNVEDNFFKAPIKGLRDNISDRRERWLEKFGDQSIRSYPDGILRIRIYRTGYQLQIAVHVYNQWDTILSVEGQEEASQPISKIAILIKTKTIEMPCYDVETEIYRFLFEHNPHLGDFETFRALYL